MRLKAFFILVLISMVLAVPAQALAESPLKLQTVAEVKVIVVDEKGQEQVKMVPAKKVVPGDVVYYTITFNYSGDQPASNVAITNPVPEHMEYVDGSAAGAGADIRFSIDQGQTYDYPGNLKIKNPEGTERTATAKEYTTIQWTLTKDLMPGAIGTVQYQARLK
ncbi:DUF11 domain-containing protein [Desulfatibacillum aliphaticivorans]|uniref:DUF11 domain-containing protein n=1 Tax=Desulfatibacillum aliphaticivorans TaxID=218208 RepID=UPI0004262DC7|nr:DUF11 domain-containing protein [Desulfatibacillum aliphaticivorans]